MVLFAGADNRFYFLLSFCVFNRPLGGCYGVSLCYGSRWALQGYTAPTGIKGYNRTIGRNGCFLMGVACFLFYWALWEKSSVVIDCQIS
ncbi:hypothetical protein BDV18DRAFT_36922 [Aspergillus unguis]